MQRLTVYRHFPDERDLFAACSSLYDELNPSPDPSDWLDSDDPETRLRTGLSEIYDYYDRTEPMLSKVYRDLELKPVLNDSMDDVGQYFEEVLRVLTEPWTSSGPGDRFIVAAIGHATHFMTWRSLVRFQGLSNEEAIDLMVSLVKSARSSEIAIEG